MSGLTETEIRALHEALYTLFVRYRLPIPENSWLGRAARYASLQAACEAGVAAKIAGKMYGWLLMAIRRCVQGSATGGGGARHSQNEGGQS